VHHGGMEHRDVHNVYGKLYHQVKASAESILRSLYPCHGRHPCTAEHTDGQSGKAALPCTSAAAILAHQASAQGLTERGALEYGENGDRPFVLSRAFFAGTQTVCCGTW
jgi:alpha-glucosidase (family GH31 glycosyl hydrolase)